MIIQTKAKIFRNKRVKGNYWYCVFEAAKIAKLALPGQFVNIKISENNDSLLRRPFSIHQKSTKHIEVLYEVVGKGTEIFSKKRAGEFLDIIGPLGSGFDSSLPLIPYPFPLLVAGGMGVAPLVFLAKQIVTKTQSHHVTSPPLVLIGAKTERQILCEKEFKKLGCSVKIATDDGSRGYKGRVTDLLKDILCGKSCDSRVSIYACGPGPMLRAVSDISKKNNIDAQLSLEAHMACGIGACLGCVVNTKQGYKRVCKEGPVFEASQIIWKE